MAGYQTIAIGHGHRDQKTLLVGWSIWCCRDRIFPLWGHCTLISGLTDHECTIACDRNRDISNPTVSAGIVKIWPLESHSASWSIRSSKHENIPISVKWTFRANGRIKSVRRAGKCGLSFLLSFFWKRKRNSPWRRYAQVGWPTGLLVVADNKTNILELILHASWKAEIFGLVDSSTRGAGKNEFMYSWRKQLYHTFVQYLLGPQIRLVRGLVKFVPALAYDAGTNFTKPLTRLICGPSM